MLSAIPLLSIVLLLANLVAFGAQTGFAEPLFALPLPSGGTVAFDTGDALILLGLALLYVEIFKATRTSSMSVLDHALSLVVFIIALVELLILRDHGHVPDRRDRRIHRHHRERTPRLRARQSGMMQ